VNVPSDGNIVRGSVIVQSSMKSGLIARFERVPFPCAKEAPHYRVARLAGKAIVPIFLTI